jgi:hypothetical protein
MTVQSSKRQQQATLRRLRLASPIAAMPIAAILIASAGASPRMVAHAAHTLSGTATAHLSLDRPQGKTLIEHGPVSGALVGTVHAELHTGAVFKASFKITTHAGTITGHGEATPHGSGRYQSFSGTFIVTSGSGRYAHIHGHAGLYGVVDRRTDNVTVQTTGKLSY